MYEKYKRMREKYVPGKVKTIFIFESPPKTGTYFYDDSVENMSKPPLFKIMMKNVLRINPVSKKEGLKKFRDEGYIIVDATYEPINEVKSRRRRNRKIIKNYENLKKDLCEIMKKEDKSTRIILVKCNVIDMLKERMKKEGYNIVNGKDENSRIPFPSNGHQKRFEERMKLTLNLNLSASKTTASTLGKLYHSSEYPQA